jgi:DNA repair protein RadC
MILEPTIKNMIIDNTLNEISISYTKSSNTDISITTATKAVEVARQIYTLSECNMDIKEYFFILLLNRSNKVIGYNMLSEGGITGTVADIRLAFSIALKSLACGMILIHNHPSGNTKPSLADIELTSKFKSAGELLDITVIDHLVITTDDCYSFESQS